MAAAVGPSPPARGTVCPESPPAIQPVSRRKKPYPWSDMLNRRVVFNCCWRTWIEYGAANESCNKGSMTKEEFYKSLEKQPNTRLRDSRELEAFWSAFCSSSGMVGSDGLECNLRFFRDGVEPSWEGSGAHGKFTYSTKKRYTKVKLFALLRTLVLEVLAHSTNICGVVLSCRDQKDFISVWNMSPEAEVQRKTLDELMSVLDITASTDCIHYLVFGDLLPGDMRQKIAARTMHASVQRQQFQMKDAERERSHTLTCDSTSCNHRISACLFVNSAGLEALVDACEQPSTSSPLAPVARDGTANSDIIDSSGAEPLMTSCHPGSPGIPSVEFLPAPVPPRALVICVPLAAAAIWWLWSTWVTLN